MKTVLFVTNKHPDTPSAGDVMMTRLQVKLARELYSISTLAMANGIPPTSDVAIVPKPKVNLPVLAARSLLRNRSLVHVRFDTADLRSALKDAHYDRVVADHSYMAESFLAVHAAEAKTRLLVNSVVSEAAVIRGTRKNTGIWGWEAGRTERDEMRVAQAARMVSAFDADEASSYEKLGVPAIWLDLTMPPRERVLVENNPPRLVFVGDLTWQPNKDAISPLLAAWPAIAKGIVGAELFLVGKGSEDVETPEGVSGLGYVDDLDAVLATCRALVAPIAVGGGVRVKLLETSAIGLPAIASKPAIGSLDRILPYEPLGPSEMVERARELLLEPEKAGRASVALYEANRTRWEEREPLKTMQRWLEA